MIKAVLFDNDGTIVDTEAMILAGMRYAMEKVTGKDLSDKALMCNVGKPLVVQMEILDPENSEALVVAYREYNHLYHDRDVKTFDGMPEALRELKTLGYKMGVVTSKMHFLTVRGLELLEIDEYFDFVIGTDDVPNGESKPHPTPLLMAAERLGLKPSECVYVGDSPYDIQAANAAKMPSLAVYWGVFTEDEIKASSKVDYEAQEIQELVKVVQSIG
jgi:pyrophosphatase PpaX